jgi:hypothetical protein
MSKKCAEPISGHQTERLHAHLHGQLRPNGHVQQHIRAHSFQVRSTKVSNVVFSRNKFPFLFSPSATFWSYLVIRTVLGVLTAASLMMFEGAVMATIQVVIFLNIFLAD